ncbi:DUF3037 domain-containing protein [Cellulophaga baltica]|uniref:DUF3037 domain-containing protein n=1 Tax=Cellulophaga baltica TaxID=76594 RepID=UPI00214818C7|nr:DUF3037 domain-containing protein [Cellulophaga baltica]MCR1026739.1 DUF3037 domain-containing protein [Cellulophaga baltica]
MQDRAKYEYAIIRIVPKVEREEFFNVGVIIFSRPKKFLKMKYHIDQKKLGSFVCEKDFEALNAYLKGWDLVCKGEATGGAIGKLDITDRFRWLTASRSTIIQSSITHSGLTADPEQELEIIFKDCVL